MDIGGYQWILMDTVLLGTKGHQLILMGCKWYVEGILLEYHLLKHGWHRTPHQT